MVAMPTPAQPATARAPGILPLRVEGVGYRAEGRDLLHDISLRLEPGTRTIILGPNGAGKTLLLRTCHGLLRPTSGVVRWEGPLAAQAQRHQAMVFQKPVLLRRSASANVAYPLQ